MPRAHRDRVRMDLPSPLLGLLLTLTLICSCCPSYWTIGRLTWLASTCFLFFCTQWLTLPARFGAPAYVSALLVVLCPDMVASPAYRAVFWLAALTYISIPGDWRPPMIFNLFAIAVLALLADVICIGLGFYVEQHVAVHHTSPYRHGVADLCPPSLLQSGPPRFEFSPVHVQDHRNDDTALATAWLLYRALDAIPQPQLEAVFCDIDLMVHILLPSGDTASTQGYREGSNRSKKLAQHLHCLGNAISLDTPPAAGPPDPTIQTNLDALVRLREYVADAVYTYITEFVPLFELIYSYADWHFDSHMEMIPNHPSAFDNGFAMPCDARAGDFSILATWLWLRCTAFPSYRLSTSSRYSAASGIQWLLSHRSSRQLRTAVLPGLHSLLTHQPSSLLNLTKRSMIPSWTHEQTVTTLGDLFPDKPVLQYEYLTMIQITHLPSQPDILTLPRPNMAVFATIHAQQSAMGISDDQATKFNRLLDGLRQKGRERYAFFGGIDRSTGHETFISEVDSFLELILGSGSSSSSSSSSSPPSQGIFPCITSLLHDTVLGYRVTRRWDSDASKTKRVREMKQKADVKRVERRGFVGLVDGVVEVEEEEGRRSRKGEERWWWLPSN